MKILLINYEYPPLGGGAGNASYYLAKCLVQKKHEVFVLTSHFGNLPPYQKEKNLQIFRLPVGRKKIDRSSLFQLFIFALKGIIASRKICCRFRPDISLAFFTIPSGLIALWLKKFYHLRYLVSLRGADVPGFFGEKRMRLAYQLTNPLTKLIWQQAERVVANSEGLKKLALQSLADLKIEIIPNGVDTNFFKPKQKTKNKKLILLFVGRLDEQKGLKYLVQATPKIQNTKYKIQIVGDGLEYKNLKSQISNLKIKNRITFTGWLDKKNLLKHYQQADIFVLPSLSEGMANSLLEAMACGLPIVATKVAGNKELVKEAKNGFLVPAKNSQKLAGALALLITNSRLRQKMAGQSRKIALNYRWSEVAERYLK